MTDKNMATYKSSKWIAFWKNLQEGYDYFETKLIPPDVTVNSRQYRFN
jgi:murein L,D-transpeptidase YafK